MTETPDDFEGLPTIAISGEALSEILQAGAQDECVFSCNSDGEVWPATRRGRIHPKDRAYIHQPALEEITGLVLKAWPTGGRFQISSRGVRLVANDEPLFAFVLTPP